MPVRKLKKFLDDHKVPYIEFSHSPAYTAQEIAASAHVPGREFAKTVVVSLDGQLAMAVLPASRQLDVVRLGALSGATVIALADEEEFGELFPECEIGAMPPFGNLYGMPLFVDAALEEDDDIAFSAGDHTELIRLPYETYKRLVSPVVGLFSR